MAPIYWAFEGKFMLRRTYRKIVFSCQEKKEPFRFLILKGKKDLEVFFPNG